DGDLLVLDRSAYYERPPNRGELVMARYEGDLLVKRVVGLTGEVVEVIGGQLLVNGRTPTLDHPVTPGRMTIGRGLLLEDHFALLGDNPSMSAAESVYAAVSQSQILRRVVFAT